MSNTYSGSPITVIGTGVTIATSGTSASATIPLDQAGNYPRYVRVVATAAAHVRIDKTSATAVTTDMLVQNADSVILHIPSGYTKIAAIQVSGAGVVQVSPLENC
jgi:hypothetical protein